MHAAIQEFFRDHIERNREELNDRDDETTEAKHGRIDEWADYWARVPKDFPLKKDWPMVKAMGYPLRITQRADGTETAETRYSILSR